MMQNLYLCHHGVKGMKWGVRKDKQTRWKEAYDKERNLSKRLVAASEASSRYLRSLSGPESRKLTRKETKTLRALNKNVQRITREGRKAYYTRIDAAGEGASRNERIVADRVFKGKGTYAKYNKALAKIIMNDKNVRQAYDDLHHVLMQPESDYGNADKYWSEVRKKKTALGKKVLKTYFEHEPDETRAYEVGDDSTYLNRKRGGLNV